MRIAALAFGVLAGLVASFILALGGLDASELRHLDGRQMQLVTFGLFVIANLGVLGAGLVLAAPLAAAVLFVVGAIGWAVAAVAMHHGPDYVMLTPPGILILAAALSVAAILRRRARAQDPDHSSRQAMAAQQAAMRDAEADPDSEDEEDDDQATSGVAVEASFFGDAGTATPLRGTMSDARRDTWEPLRRKVEPPRQKPMFREVDDEYDDEETSLSRLARGISSVLSFGLYGALAAAAVLIFLNLRTADVPRNTATKIEASVSQPKTTAPVLAPPSSAPTAVAEAPAAPALSPTPAASEIPELTAPTPPRVTGPSTAAVPAGSVSPAVAEAPAVASQPDLPPLPPGVVVAEPPADQGTPQPAAADAPSSFSAEPQSGGDLVGQGAIGPLMPYPMPAAIAAGRPTAAVRPRPAAPAAPAPQADQGL